MMEQKTTQEKHDRAKYKLAASIKGVHETTPVDRITVKGYCGGQRPDPPDLFTASFKDKYDLINWYFDKLVLQSLSRSAWGIRWREFDPEV